MFTFLAILFWGVNPDLLTFKGTSGTVTFIGYVTGKKVEHPRNKNISYLNLKKSFNLSYCFEMRLIHFISSHFFIYLMR